MPDPSFILPLVLQSAVIPFAVSIAALLILCRLGSGLAAPLAIGLGLLGSYIAVFHNQWSFPPRQALDWLPVLIVIAIGGAAAAENSRYAAGRRAARLVVSLVVAAIVAWPALASFGVQKAALTVALAGGAMFALWASLGQATKTRAASWAVLTVVAGGAGLAMMLDVSQLLGQLSGALAIACAACFLFSLGGQRAGFSGAGMGVAVLLLGALLANAYIYAGFSLAYIALLACGLLADPLLQAVHHLRSRKENAGHWAAAAVLAAIPVLIVIGFAVKAMHESGGY